MDKEKQIKRDIEKAKKKLIAKCKARGIYENFGQIEVARLQERYSDLKYCVEFEPILEFDNWCMRYNGV